MVQAVILAGGLGTRLRSVHQGPKCLVPIQGIPIISWIIRRLHAFDIHDIFVSVGYKADEIVEYLEDTYHNSITPIPEKILLGTGGAMFHVLPYLSTAESFLLLNGDTYTEVDFHNLLDFHKKKHAMCTLTTKYVSHNDRYGTVQYGSSGTITLCKANHVASQINAGVYALHKQKLLSTTPPPSPFHLENDYLIHYPLYGYETKGKFIDIGVPEDLNAADQLFSL